MEFHAVQKSLTEVECDVLVVNLFEGVKQPGGATGAVDHAVKGAITALIEREKFEGKLGDIADLTPCEGVKAARILIVGLGKRDEFCADKVREASSAAARRAKDLSAVRVATILHGAGVGGIDPKTAARALVEGAILGAYQFVKYKTVDVKPNTIEEIDIVEMDAAKIEAIRDGISRGAITAEATNYARDLTNEPANVLTPSYLAEQAAAVARETGIECKVLGREAIERLGMNLLLAVARGSRQEPKFIIMRYNAHGATKTVALVGKGITFDSGGISIKPSEGMEAMKDDMSGAGIVLATMKAIAELKPKVNILALLPTTENMPGPDATKPGDVVRGLSGKTVEINNTDAEGRLVLSDAVAYAEIEKVDEIVDVATLTGTCVVALGRGMAGILGTDQALIDRLIAAGAQGGEKLWQLPLYEPYKDQLKSEVADMKNTGGREGGTIVGALFIKKHIENTPWAHIDIAGPASLDKESALSPKGGTGFGARTLINYLIASGEP